MYPPCRTKYLSSHHVSRYTACSSTDQSPSYCMYVLHTMFAINHQTLLPLSHPVVDKHTHTSLTGTKCRLCKKRNDNQSFPSSRSSTAGRTHKRWTNRRERKEEIDMYDDPFSILLSCSLSQVQK